MKVLMSILLVLGLIMGVYKGYEYWERVNNEKALNDKARLGENIAGKNLPGVTWQAEQRYQEAMQRGPAAVKAFLTAFAKSPGFKDPRRAWIELDYVVSITASEPVEAKQLFYEVKKRISTNSVIYPRVRTLAPTYE